MLQLNQILGNSSTDSNLHVFAYQNLQFQNLIKEQTYGFEDQFKNIQNVYQIQQWLIRKELFFRLQNNNNLISLLDEKINQLDQTFYDLNEEFAFLEKSHSEASNVQEKQSSVDLENNLAMSKKVGRIHYKTLFREKIFGVKSYKYRLNIDGRTPQVLFKERNICLKISLENLHGHKIENQNAIGLNLKAFYSTGEEVGETKKGQNFIKGTINSTMVHGKASFDKLYPRQVSRKLQSRKIVLVIYPSKMGNNLDQNMRNIEPEEIQPIIIYGVKVITKQNKPHSSKKQDRNMFEQESQFVA